MRMRMMLIIIVAMIGFSVSQTKAEDFPVTISVRGYSGYIAAPIGDLLYDRGVVQTDLFVELGKGFYFDLWHSVGADGTGWSSGFDDEIDYTLGWAGEFKGIDLDFSMAYFDCVDLFKMPGGDFIYPYVDLSKDLDDRDDHCLRPYVRFAFPYSAKGNEFGHGFHTNLGIKHSWQQDEKLNVAHKANLLFDDGTWGYSKGIIGGYELVLTWQISESMAIELTPVSIISPFISMSDHRKTEAVCGIGIIYRK